MKRADFIVYFMENGFRLHRKGGRHSIFTNGVKVIPIKRHKVFDRITANE